jgi:hypothetical protein
MDLLEKFAKKKKKKPPCTNLCGENGGRGVRGVFIFVIPAGFVYFKISESKNHQFRVFEN